MVRRYARRLAFDLPGFGSAPRAADGFGVTA
jgi:hypothetical protein